MDGMFSGEMCKGGEESDMLASTRINIIRVESLPPL